MNDPNQVQRYRPTMCGASVTGGAMEKYELGMWVNIHNYWELKDEWIKQNILIEELRRMIK